MFNRSKNVHITTKTPLLGICCYIFVLFLLFLCGGIKFYSLIIKQLQE